ncbi:PIR protein [Plasmodium vivax]|uniref:VIR protein n=1 Tax=Plasmodium vivax TaxID=5855 RepID=A0A565A5D9_PLAVI|nr:PIR protein [Plasmodium vivax]
MTLKKIHDFVLHDNNKRIGSDHISDKYPEFLNYWLKHQLNVNNIHKDHHTYLYDHLKSNYSKFDEEEVLYYKIYDIEYYFNNINVLYLLYKKYVDIKDQQSKDCKKFLETSQENYNKALDICFQDGNDNLCKGLKSFNVFYKNHISEISKKCPGLEIPTLSELVLLNLVDDKGSKKQNIGYNLVQTNSDYSDMGLPKIERGIYPNLTGLLSYKYNIRFESDKNKNNCNLMKILHEFFKYCEKNNSNEHLLPFIQEFINEYYKKKQSEYEKIFQECSKTTSSEYCQIHKNCQENFNSDIEIIKQNPDNYIKHQKKNINKYSADTSSIANTLSMFLDFAANSKYSTTIISIMISFFLCFFFLYKFTPLSSIFRKEKKRKKIPLFFPERRVQDVKDDNIRHKNVKHKRGKIRFAYQPS